MKKSSAFLMAFVLVVATASAAVYRNPVISGFAPDPSICRVGTNFYLCNSSFTMFPALPIYQSSDLVNWKLIGHAGTRESQVPLLGGDFNSGIWAPTIRHHDGRFYVIVKNQAANEMILLSTKDPAGEWSDKIIVGGKSWSVGIDPDLFFDADGTAYVTKPTWVNGRARFDCWKLDLKTGAVSDKRELWKGVGYKYEEGPHLYRIGNYYYLLLAEGGTGAEHRVTLARRPVAEGLGSRSEDWEPCPANPIVYNDPKKNPEIRATGHADLVQDASGNWWLVFLGTRDTPAPNLGRETHLAPVEWRDSWPVVNQGKLITLEMRGDQLPPRQPWPPEPVRDEFDAGMLGLEWNFFRNPAPESWSLTRKPGSLVLKSTDEDLSGTGRVAYLGRRLRSKECRFTASVAATPAKDQAAGISLFSKQGAYLEMVLHSGPNGREVLLRRRDGEALPALAALPAPGSSPVQLEWVVQAEEISSRVSLDAGKSWRTIHTGKIGQLIPYPGFAGLYFGMQATGPGTEAVFAWSEYENLQQRLVISPVETALRPLSPDEVRGFTPPSRDDGRIEAETGVLKGPRVESERPGLSSLGFIKDGATVEFKGVVLRDLVKTVTACVAAGGQGGVIEVWSGGTAGTLVARLEVPHTGGWKSWREIMAPVSEWKPGRYDLTLVFRGDADYLLNLDWIRFDTAKSMATN
jgi:xylan 1,4-beta-xylosidase